MKKHLVLGASGFLGGALEHRLKADGDFVVSASRSRPKYRESIADEFHIIDLRDAPLVHVLMARHEYENVWQLAGEVGGLGYISTGQHDAEIMTNSLKINLAVLNAARLTTPGKILFSSSHCVYMSSSAIAQGNAYHSNDEIYDIEYARAAYHESDARFDTFPFAQEKLFSEKLYAAYGAAYGLDVRIARLGNTYGPCCTWDGARAKAPAAICRKVAQAPYAGIVDLWGSGKQSRSFTYVDDAVDGLIRLMASNYWEPVNIASAETVTIEQLFETTCHVAGKILAFKQVDGPVGVQHRSSDNSRCKHILGWEPVTSITEGLRLTYPWVKQQVDGLVSV